MNYAQAIIKNMEFTSHLSYAIVTTFAADLGLTTLWGALCSGGQLHIITYDRAADPESFAEYFRKNNIDVLKIVPSHFEALKGVANLKDIIPNKYLIFGGEASNWDTIAKIKSIKPECTIINHYGPTETTVGMLTYKVEEIPYKDLLKSVPLGRPLTNTKAYILDGFMQLVPIGVAGELCIGGDGVTSGYLNRPELTAEKYVPDLFATEPGKSLYRTGDLVRYLSDGNIEFLGRMDSQVKIRGYRIEIGEIEALLKNHPLLQDGVVVVREDKPGEKQLVAYVVLKVKSDENYSSGTLREYLKKQLPSYMIPGIFVLLEVIPLNANGKIDRLALPVPDFSLRDSEDIFIAPRNKEEINMAKIWSQVLGIEKLGIDDNFFDLGGDSFKAIKVVRSISNKLGVMELFRNPTIRELVVHLSANISKKNNVLHELTKPIAMNKKTVSLICVPYGGASAITFQPLANVMPKGYSLYSVELPGHDYSCPDEQLTSIEEAAKRCFEEIKMKVKGPIVLYGHCLGGSLVMILAYMLEEAGIKVDGVVMGAIFPSPRLSNKLFDFWSKIFPNVLSEKGYRDLLKSVGGLNDTISPEESKFLLKNLRHDSIQSEEAFTKFYKDDKKTKIKAPITCVVGGSDRMTEFYQERYKEWEDFSETVDLKVIEFAGHYFQKYQATELSNIIEEKVDIWQGRTVEVSHAVEIEKRVEKQINPSMKLFLIVAIAQIISTLGSILSGFATGIWVYHQSGALSEFAMMFLIGLLPTILLLPLSGAIVDRFDRRLILILCDTATALSSLWLFILLYNNYLQLWHIYVIIVIGSMAGAFKRPAYMAAITQISPKKYFMQANSISQFSGAIGGIMAPVFGGLVIESIGFEGIVAIDFVTFILAIVTLVFVRFPNTMFRKQEEPIIKEIIGGWNFIVKRESLVAMVIFFIVCNFFESMFDVIVTPLSLTFAKPSALGIITAFSAIGTLVGSIIMMMTGGTKKRAKGMVGFMLFSAISIMVAGLRPSPVFVSIALFGFGLSVALVDIHWQSIIQVKVGLELQGRVFAINQMLAWSMRPFSYISAGLLADKVFEPIMRGNNAISGKLGPIIGLGKGRGMALMLIIAGAILFVWTIIGLKYKPLYEMDDLLLDAVPDAITVKDKDKLQELADRKVAAILETKVEAI
jgi:surfactin synthase thioesterase subunit/MFS family permease